MAKPPGRIRRDNPILTQRLRFYNLVGMGEPAPLLRAAPLQCFRPQLPQQPQLDEPGDLRRYRLPGGATWPAAGAAAGAAPVGAGVRIMCPDRLEPRL